MRVLFLLIFSVSLFADMLGIENFRTDLYSKTGNNVLKKIELELELEGENLEKNKIIDALNTIVSSFFYEDLFTEIGKNNFKETLLKFSNKKYNTQIKNIYILKLNSVSDFDLEELKRFLKDFDAKDEVVLKEKITPKPQIPEANISKIDENLTKDTNKSKIEQIENNLSQEALNKILDTMQKTQTDLIAPSKEQDLFQELPF